MTKHLLRDLDSLQKRVLRVGGLVEEAILKATTAMLERKHELAAAVLKGDDAIDAEEVLVEEDCLKILALHQPVAGDLRHIVAILKVNNDLERMGDLATNIAARVQELLNHPPVVLPAEFRTMVSTVRRMVRDALDALIKSDIAIAREVLAADDVVDQIHRQMFREMKALAQKDPANLEAPISFLSVSRYLERIADQCTNIAEDVIFKVEGEIVRHRHLR